MQTFGLESYIIKPNADLIQTIWQVFKINKIRPLNGDILVVSSKIVALCQGCLAKIEADKDFLNLVKKQADKFFGGKIPLTLKENILIPQAGIDRSNAPKGFVVLWPKNPWQIARKSQKAVCEKFGLKKFGIVISDSHCQPLRWGVTGIAVAFAGFVGVEDIRGKKDLFKRPLKITKKAVADNLASSALLMMGEAAEKTPFVLVRGAPVKFTSRLQKKSEIFIKPKKCLFAPLYKKTLI